MQNASGALYQDRNSTTCAVVSALWSGTGFHPFGEPIYYHQASAHVGCLSEIRIMAQGNQIARMVVVDAPHLSNTQLYVRRTHACTYRITHLFFSISNHLLVTRISGDGIFFLRGGDSTGSGTVWSTSPSNLFPRLWSYSQGSKVSTWRISVLSQ